MGDAQCSLLTSSLNVPIHPLDYWESSQWLGWSRQTILFQVLERPREQIKNMGQVKRNVNPELTECVSSLWYKSWARSLNDRVRTCSCGFLQLHLRNAIQHLREKEVQHAKCHLCLVFPSLFLSFLKWIFFFPERKGWHQANMWCRLI